MHVCGFVVVVVVGELQTRLDYSGVSAHRLLPINFILTIVLLLQLLCITGLILHQKYLAKDQSTRRLGKIPNERFISNANAIFYSLVYQFFERFPHINVSKRIIFCV